MEANEGTSLYIIHKAAHKYCMYGWGLEQNENFVLNSKNCEIYINRVPSAIIGEVESQDQTCCLP